MFKLSLIAALALLPTLDRPFDPCPPSSQIAGRPYFEFQVNQPAVYLGTDSTTVRPDATQNGRPPHPPDFALAQFVVDSLGVPIPGTLKMLTTPTGFSLDAVSVAITEWRYRPARVASCPVAQLVQTPLRWK